MKLAKFLRTSFYSTPPVAASEQMQQLIAKFLESPAQATETEQLKNCGGAKFITTVLILLKSKLEYSAICSIKYWLKSDTR